ncbi:MAG: sulfatase-like hydrolase/transferase, partial [Candidatus Eisenbacteria bacterium]|nr:sulfatase-like hydrolase/transferase [Candidatus Eisenbacteria bacterium]
AECLSCYGSTSYATPNLDRLASEGVLFENSFSTNPITLPSHTSIMTGSYPMYHGVRDNSTYVVRPDVETLAEVLSANGYATHAVIGSFVLDSRFNLDQGFDSYDDRLDENWSKDELEMRARDAFGFAERKANLVTASAIDWLRKPRSKPFFLWLHYFDPHQPVNPPEPHHSRFTEPYAGEVAFADEQIGAVFQELKKQGEYDRTLVVVVADHGEGLLDHGEPTHSILIFDSTLRVPLIVKMPGAPEAGRHSQRLTSTVDIMPSILDLVHAEAPLDIQTKQFQGKSFASLIEGEPDPEPTDRPIYMETMVPQLDCGWGPLRALRTADWKLIHGPKTRLYHVSQDRGEVYDLAAKEPDRVAAMTAELQSRIRDVWASEDAGGSVSAPDKETLAKLASLGYLGGTGAPRVIEDLSEVDGKPDPYDNRYLFDLISSAIENIRTGQEFRGMQQLQDVLASDPANPMALLNLGRAYLTVTGQADSAMAIFRRCLHSDPQQEDALYYMSRINRELGRPAEAKVFAAKILEVNEFSVPGHYEMAGIESALGDNAEARNHLLAVLELEPGSVPANLELGVLYARDSMHDESGTYFKRALDLDPKNPQVLYNVGVWYMVDGQKEEAISALRRALSYEPDHRDANYVLGKIYFDQNDAEDARTYLLKAKTVAVTQDRRQAIDAMLVTLGT